MSGRSIIDRFWITEAEALRCGKRAASLLKPSRPGMQAAVLLPGKLGDLKEWKLDDQIRL